MILLVLLTSESSLPYKKSIANLLGLILGLYVESKELGIYVFAQNSKTPGFLVELSHIF